jgi:uncharacterized protein (TIGR02246 family)
MSAQSPEEIHRAFTAAFNAGDMAALLDLYEPDASIAPAPGEIVTGLEAIREALAGFLALNGQMSIETLRVIPSGDVALLHGMWLLTGASPDGSPLELAGRNTEIVRRQADGSWRFVVDNPFGDA